MKLFWRIMAVVTCIAALTGCTQPTEPTQPTEAIDPSALYTEAAAAIAGQAALSYQLETAQRIHIGTDTYTRQASSLVSYEGKATDDFAASCTETVLYGDYSVQNTEYYLDNTRYTQINGSCFRAAETGEKFMARIAPAVLLDAALYETVTWENADGNTLLFFADAVCPEAWVNVSEFTEASGSAVISQDGALTQCYYEITYTAGSATIECSYTATLTNAAVERPSQTDTHLALDVIDAPAALEAACGYLSQAGNVTSLVTESLTSQAAGLTRDRKSAIIMASTGGRFLAKLTHTTLLTDANRGGMTSTATHTELYRNGHYSLDDALETKTLAAREMYSYITNMLVEHILLPQYLTQATVKVENGTYLLEFTCSEELAQLLNQLTARELLENSTALDALADSYRTLSVTGWLRMDAGTYLPLGAGLGFAGEHTIGGYRYGISYQLDQSFSLGDENVRAAILAEETQKA